MIQKLKLKIEQSYYYDKVYSGSVDGKISTGEVLESLFVKFNLEFPADYRARSMSVSDVVVLHKNSVDKAYFCDSIGFVEVPQFLRADAMITMDTTGKVVAEDVWNGFSPEILAMIAEEQGLILTQPASINEANYLAPAEGHSEENYNMIDGRIDTKSKLTPGDDTESQPEQTKGKRPSVLENLKKSTAGISPARFCDDISHN